MGYSPWARKDSDTTEVTSTHTHTHTSLEHLTALVSSDSGLVCRVKHELEEQRRRLLTQPPVSTWVSHPVSCLVINIKLQLDARKCL